MTTSNPSRDDLLATLKANASSHGLAFFGAATLDTEDDAAHYELWLDEGRHGEMTWMTNHLSIRKNPRLLLTGAKSALIYGFPYFLGDRWSRARSNERPKIAQYARLPDYHRFLRKKLEKIWDSLRPIIGTSHEHRIAVDSAPLLERALAAKSGSMFIGKNTCAINPLLGSFFLLGEILTTWDGQGLATNEPIPPTGRTAKGGCGTCRRCQVHCPTGALDQDYRIDARKCLSYWTIEHRGEIPTTFWIWISRYLFGCDICQLVCPYNRRISPSNEALALERRLNYRLVDIACMDQHAYERMFGGTPMTRAKRSGLRRNAIIAAAVRKDPETFAILDQLLNDTDPVVRATAITAKSY